MKVTKFLILTALILLCNAAIIFGQLQPPPQNKVLRFGGFQTAMLPSGGLSYTNQATLETWIYVEAASPNGIIMGHGTSPALRFNASGVPVFTVNGVSATATGPLPLNTWTHLAGVRDAANVKLFVNGQEVASAAASGTISVGGTFSVGGGTTENGGRAPNGISAALRQVRVWNRALSATEIQNNAGVYLTGAETGLIGYFPLDDNHATATRNLVSGGGRLRIGLREFAFELLGEPHWTTPRMLETGPYFSAQELPINTQGQSIGGFDGRLIDFDSDGDLDVLMNDFDSGSPTPQSLLAFRNDGSGNFTNASSTVFTSPAPTNVHARDYAIADFNGDGRMDAFMADHGYDAFPFPGAQSRILIQTADGKLADETAARLPQIAAFTHHVSAGDIDGDGDIDLYMCNLAGQAPADVPKQPRFYINNGSGVFTADAVRLPESFRNVSGGYTASEFIDVDNDNDLDLVLGAANYMGYLKDVLLINNGTGIYTLAPGNAMPPRYGGTTWGTVEIARADVNNDGFKDMLMSTARGYEEAKMQLLLNNRNGTFSDATNRFEQNFPTRATDNPNGSYWVKCLFPTDFNNDGLIDFVASPDTQMETRLFMNKGQGYFADVTGLLPPNSPGVNGIALPGNLDGDADIDLFITSAYWGSYYVIRQQKTYAVVPVTASLPTLNVEPGATLTIPITVGDLTGQNVTAYDFDLQFDPSVLQLVSGNPTSNAGTMSANFTITPNPNTPGKLVVSASGIAPLTGSGTLLNLNFQVIGQGGASSPLAWQMFNFNGGEPHAVPSDGQVTINSPCSYTLSPSSPQSVGASASTLTVNVTAPAGCAWTAASNSGFITVTGGASGSGNGAVSISIAANTGAARSGTLTIAGQTYTINQADGTPVCTYNLNPTSENVAANAGSSSFTVTTQTGCAWTAQTSSSFLTTNSTGSGSGTVNYSYQANTGAARSGTITVGGQTFTVNQVAVGTPNDQPILFISNRDGNSEIYRMNENGTNQQRLTNTTANESSAFWSPDGTKILYLVNISSTQRQIWTMNADGSGKTPLTDGTELVVVEGWSPNGTKVLYSKPAANFAQHLWVMNADGSGKTQLTNTANTDHIASWSPNGSKIAFGRCLPEAQLIHCDIYTMNSDGSGQTNLTPNNPNDDDGAKWSPDGSKIYYNATLNGVDSDVIVMNADGSNKVTLRTFNSPQFFSGLNLSPDGAKIGGSYNSTGAIDGFEAALMSINGTGFTNLTNNSVFDTFGDWSPDAAKIAFQSRRDNSQNEIYTMNSDGSGVIRLTFNSANDSVSDWYRPQQITRRAPYDFDGDGKTDVSVFRPSDGSWWYLQSSNSQFKVYRFGISSDTLVPGDYTGDGKTDIAVFRDGTWFVQRSEDNSFFSFPFGTNGDIAAPADYDADGKTDAAVFRPSSGTWFILNSGGSGTSIVQFGSAEDKPVPADFDGDGKADIAIFRPSDGSWWYLQSSNSQFKVYRFGVSTDKPVQGDYTGDGKADIAVFRPSTGEWFFQRSEDNSYYSFVWGAAGDTPAPGDYDGDGKSDASVFRPSNATWYMNQTAAGVGIVQFGSTDDRPVPNAFVP